MGSRSTVEARDTIWNLNYLFVKYLLRTTFVKCWSICCLGVRLCPPQPRRGNSPSLTLADFPFLGSLWPVPFPTAPRPATGHPPPPRPPPSGADFPSPSTFQSNVEIEISFHAHRTHFFPPLQEISSLNSPGLPSISEQSSFTEVHSHRL